VISFLGASGGSAAGSVSRQGQDMEGLVRASEAAAREAGPAEDAAPLLSGVASADFGEPPETTSGEAFGAFAPALGERLRAAAADGIEWFGYAEHEVDTLYLASSTGLRLRHAQPQARVEITAKSHQRTRSTWVGAGGRAVDAAGLEAMDSDLRTRLGWQARRLDVAPGRYSAILPPSALADLMVYLFWSAGARDAFEGRTVFSRQGGGTRIGETLSERALRLFSDPRYPGLECEPFLAAAASGPASSVFDNGLPLGPVDWLHDGRLAALLQSRYSAHLTGLPLTAPTSNLILTDRAGSADLSGIVAGTDRGLLLTCLWYIREVDPQSLLLTGLTRDGVYVIEGGEVVGATTNFRFNDSPVGILDRLSEVGVTVPTIPREWADSFLRAAMPPVRVDDFNMSTVSQAY
jgi:predicted Zn-dependent protease